MHIHILGICGTFMGGIAQIAREMGFKVSGSDQGVYPPMSTQLEKAGIDLQTGYQDAQLKPHPDAVVIGNALSRGNEAVEYVLNHNLPYFSGPQWLAQNILKDRWVIAISGTHGKTTTSSMVAWILEYAGFNPGFLIGGVPENFGVSARLGDSSFFVIEADEYDTAFFDKRSKFVHYYPKTCIINNLEFDHADIFENLDAIKKQFHHLMRIVPGMGSVIYPKADQNVQSVISMGCWSQQQPFEFDQGEHCSVKLIEKDGSAFSVYLEGQCVGKVSWSLLGEHNVKNAMAAILAARSVGIMPEVACQALEQFKSVKRRLEKRGCINDITVYDDFAHHPTAIVQTLKGLRNNIGQNIPLVAVVDLRSNTMKQGTLSDSLLKSFDDADNVILYQSEDVKWSVSDVFKSLDKATIYNQTKDIINHLLKTTANGAHICIMSNGGFDNIHEKLLKALKDRSMAA